jgi:hypothetical protein
MTIKQSLVDRAEAKMKRIKASHLDQLANLLELRAMRDEAIAAGAGEADMAKIDAILDPLDRMFTREQKTAEAYAVLHETFRVNWLADGGVVIYSGT